MNMTNPEYRVNIGENGYFLWVDEDAITLMNVKDTHMICTLTELSVKLVNDEIANYYTNKN
ncbi:hypothetical protein L3i20_v232610 [Paenibacillus sp. L3-i20]|nr:hypothetical protein L3i20_v232610 [Paenibacillus sp. L3-i20]